MRSVHLNQDEILELDKQAPATRRDGGWQSLLVRLQEKVNRVSGQLDLDDQDLEQIPRYAFDYKNGGWELRLMAIFSRSLGQRLGRQ